jgi:hypothetical protein
VVSIYRLQNNFFKCFSKSWDFWQSLKEMAVLIRQGLNFEVWGFLQPFASLLHFKSKGWSGREDLNLRLPAPKAGALPGCATPRQQIPLSLS